jgi:DNA-binding protein HU-beta
MNKKELIREVANASAIPSALAGRVLDAAMQTIVESLARGEAVRVSGFGSFSVRWRAARAGRHPHTGENIEIPQIKVPVFRPGKVLKTAAQRAPDLLAMRPPAVY